MGKKGSWISVVKKALSSESKEKKDKVSFDFDFSNDVQTKTSNIKSLNCVWIKDL